MGERWVLHRGFDGEPRVDDFKLVKEELPELADGHILIRADYLSVDPYQRAYLTKPPKKPMTMLGSVLATVEASRNDKYPEVRHS